MGLCKSREVLPRKTRLLACGKSAKLHTVGGVLTYSRAKYLPSTPPRATSNPQTPHDRAGFRVFPDR